MAFQDYTLGEIRAMLETKWDQAPFWSDVEATNAINEGLLVWNSLTGYWKGVDTLQTTPGTPEYVLPSSLAFGMTVKFNGKPLTESSLEEIDDAHPGWMLQTTVSGGNVPNTVKHWVPISLTLIAIWPADAVGKNTLTVSGMAVTPVLVNDTDFINIGNDELNVLLGYALHIAAFKEGGERWANTQTYFTDFLKEAAEYNDQLHESGMFREFIGTDMRRQELPTRGKPTDYDELASPYHNWRGGRNMP